MQVWSDTSPVLFIQQHTVDTGISQRALDVRAGASVTATEHFFYSVLKKVALENTSQSPVNDKYSHPNAQSHFQLLLKLYWLKCVKAL